MVYVGERTMRLTARSEYGMLALIDLAEAYGERPLSVREMAEERDLPTPFLEQLFAALRRAGLVTGIRGPHGGFTLARDPKSITALDIVEALEGEVAPTVCAQQGACDRSDSCAASSPCTDVATSVRETLALWDLAKLADRQRELAAHATTTISEE
jgi:Rrf2 family protein